MCNKILYNNDLNSWTKFDIYLKENGDDSGSSVKEEILFDNSYVCPFCSSAHSTYLDLRSHMKEHRDQKVSTVDARGSLGFLGFVGGHLYI